MCNSIPTKFLGMGDVKLTLADNNATVAWVME